MKLSKPIFAGLLFSVLFFGESHAQCDNSAIDHLIGNKVKAAVLNGGDFFRDRTNGQFFAPYSLGTEGLPTTIFASALWLAGFNESGQLKTACQRLGNNANLDNKRHEFWPGPIDDNSQTVFPDGCENFDFIWKTNRGDILQVLNDYADDGLINQAVPVSILNWPGKGNPNFEGAMGFTLPDQELAPFYDRNGNGLYEPMEGDYPTLDPALSDVVPDEMTWCVFNDIQDVHGETGGLPLGVEVHFMVYAFNCSENEVLNNTVFTRHKIFNKSAEDLHGFKAAFWTDFDIGCYEDDAFACDTILNSQYFYNEDNIDDSWYGGCQQSINFIGNPPVHSVTFLNQKMTNLHYNNQYLGFCDPPTSLFPPNTDNQFYYSLSSIWNDGTPLTYGGKGYDTSIVAFTNYAFPENPNDPNAWSMIAPGQYFICEIHTIMTTTKDTLHAGDEFILDGAHSFHRQPGATNLGNINVALTNIPLIQAFYDSGYDSECSQTQLCQSDCVWPGDANRDGIAKNDDLLYLGLAAGSGGIGSQRLVQSHQWMPQNADNWNLALANGQDYKNADFNGDGLLDSLDLGVLDFNYKKAVPGYIPPPQIEAPLQSNQLYLAINKDEISAANFPYRIIISASLASEDFPIEELYGLAFTLKFDTSIWELPPPTWPFPVPSPYNNNLFGENAMYIGKTDAKEGTIDVAFSKKDGQSIQDAHGVLCKIDLYIRQNAPTGNPNGMQALSFKVYDAIGVDGQGNFFTLGALSDMVIGKDMVYDSTLTTSISEIPNGSIPLTISPNPNNGTFDLFFDKTTTTSQISVFDFSGKIFWEESIPIHSDRHTVALGGSLPSGIYFVKWVLADGRFAVRKVVVK